MASRHLRRCCSVSAGALAVLAAAAPTAGARPALDPLVHAGTQPVAPTVVQSADSGFDWASGGIGAGGATIVLLLTAGGAVTLSRRYERSL